MRRDAQNHLTDHKGTTLIVVNLVCGGAAGVARPGALTFQNIPYASNVTNLN